MSDFAEVVPKILETYEGRWLLSSIIVYSGVFEPSHVDSPEYREGKRAVGVKLANHVLQTDSKKFTLMMEEQLQRHNNDTAIRNAKRANRDTEYFGDREPDRDFEYSGEYVSVDEI